MKFTTGQSLIEVLIAFAITVIIGVGLISANLVTQRASTSARNNTQATKLAQEYVEKIRLFRDVNGYGRLPTANGCYKLVNHENDDVSTWTIGNTVAPVPCTGSLTDGEVVKLPEFKSDFYRDFQVRIDAPTTKMTVFVNVSWTEGINTKVVTVETKLTNWLSI